MIIARRRPGSRSQAARLDSKSDSAIDQTSGVQESGIPPRRLWFAERCLPQFRTREIDATALGKPKKPRNDMARPTESTSLVKEPQLASVEDSCPKTAGTAPGYIRRRRFFFASLFLLVIGFGQQLYQLVRFAAGSELYSYILLIPFVSLYFVWLKRPDLTVCSKPEKKWAIVLLLVGMAVLAGSWLANHSSLTLKPEDRLAITTLSFLAFFLANCCLFLGKEWLRICAFPIGLLFFIVPCPAALMDRITTFLQHGSAMVAHLLFRFSGTPVLQHGLVFQLSNISLQVAPECSGIHSTVVLLITSLLAGHLFLRTPWKRAALALLVVPLALLRNGFRIFILGQLCVHVGPEMIHSDIHRRGGPLFFVLSLIPFCLVLFFLRKSDRARRKAESKETGA